MRREVEADLAFLESTRAGALVGPNEAEVEEILALQQGVRKAQRAGRS